MAIPFGLQYIRILGRTMDIRIPYLVLEKKQETTDTATLILQPLGTEVTYQAGQFLTLIFPSLGPKPVRRSYSLSSTPGIDNHLAITVKKMPNGSVSRFLVDKSKEGDILEGLRPAGQMVLAPFQNQRDIVLIGGGSGAVPLFSLLKQVLVREPQSRVLLIDANTRENAILFKQELQKYAVQYKERLKAYYFLSNIRGSLAELKVLMEPIHLRHERLSNAMIQLLVTGFLKNNLANAQAFVCGPANLMIKAVETLRFLGFSKEQVLQEVFTIVEPYHPPASQYQDSRIYLEYNGVDIEFPLYAGQTILEAAETAGVELPFSCRSGICTTCTMRCTEGNVEMFTPEGRLTIQSTGGIVQTCVGYPLTEAVKLSSL